MNNMSDDARNIIAFIVKELSGCSRLYRNIIHGAYIAAVVNFKFPEPIEGEEFVIDKVIEILNRYKND